MDFFRLCEILTVLFENYILISFVTQYFEFKENKFKYKKWFGLFYILICSLCFLGDKVNQFYELFFCGCVICIILYSNIALKGKKGEKFLIGLFIFIANTVITIFCLLLLSMEIGKPVSYLQTIGSYSRVIELVITKFMLYVVFKAALIGFRRKRFLFRLSDWAVIIINLVTTSLVMAIAFRVSIQHNISDSVEQMLLFLSFGLLLLSIAMFYLVINVSRKNSEKSQYEKMLTIMQEKEKSNQMMAYTYEELSKMRHDVKHYFSCAQQLLIENKKEDAVEYISEVLQKDILKGNQIVNTSSSVINAVLNGKNFECKNKNIDFNLSITGEHEGIKDVDLSILLSNLLDNAIEACEKNNQNSKIQLEIFDSKGYTNILIKNSIVDSVLTTNPEFKSTKEDQGQHGYGMKSIRDMVKKYNGMIDIYEKENQFIVEIMLQNL